MKEIETITALAGLIGIIGGVVSAFLYNKFKVDKNEEEIERLEKEIEKLKQDMGALKQEITAFEKKLDQHSERSRQGFMVVNNHIEEVKTTIISLHPKIAVIAHALGIKDDEIIKP